MTGVSCSPGQIEGPEIGRAREAAARFMFAGFRRVGCQPRCHHLAPALIQLTPMSSGYWLIGISLWKSNSKTPILRCASSWPRACSCWRLSQALAHQLGEFGVAHHGLAHALLLELE